MHHIRNQGGETSGRELVRGGQEREGEREGSQEGEGEGEREGQGEGGGGGEAWRGEVVRGRVCVEICCCTSCVLCVPSSVCCCMPVQSVCFACWLLLVAVLQSICVSCVLLKPLCCLMFLYSAQSVCRCPVWGRH